MKPITQLMALVAAALLAGCVSNPLATDRPEPEASPAAASKPAAAAPAGPADSAEDRLYQQALAQLSTDGKAYNPWQARQLLEQLDKQYPDGEHRDEVEALLNVLRDLTASANHAKALEKELARKDAALESMRATLLNQ